MARERTMSEMTRLALAAVLIVILVIFVIANTGSVTIHFIIGTAKLPLIVVLIGTTMVGMVVNELIRHRRR